MFDTVKKIEFEGSLWYIIYELPKAIRSTFQKLLL